MWHLPQREREFLHTHFIERSDSSGFSMDVGVWLLGILLLLFTSQVLAGCSFPHKFRGRWQPDGCSTLMTSSDDKCQINIGQNSVSGLSLSEGLNLEFECLQRKDNRFALRSEETTLLSYPVRIYVCWEFLETDGSILVQQLTNRVSKLSEKRGKAYLVDKSPSIFDCCDIDSSDPSLFRISPTSEEPL